MPDYAWTCQVCESPAPPGAVVCPICAAPAVISGAEIERFKCERAGLPPIEKRTDSGELTGEDANPAWLLVLGVFLVVLGIATIVGSKWPIVFTPMQLDIIAVPLMAVLGPTIGAYVVAAICFALGGGCIWLVIQKPSKHN